MAGLLAMPIALLLLLLAGWMTSGSWSPTLVRLQHLVLVLPLLAAAKLGLDRGAALFACVLTDWLVAFALVAWFIRKAGLETRSKRKDGEEV